jgi:hypothetical protein
VFAWVGTGVAVNAISSSFFRGGSEKVQRVSWIIHDLVDEILSSMPIFNGGFVEWKHCAEPYVNA